ncbi:MAG: RNA polymerase sigma factor [Planctomycetota bacterium]
MADRTDAEILQAVSRGDTSAFERLYDRYHQRVRLMAWRLSHRPDWIDDLVNEAWCRAFKQRAKYRSSTSFAAWLAGILQNVYREQCRKSAGATARAGSGDAVHDQAESEEMSPEAVAGEAEVLENLSDCVSRLPADEGRLIELRFFQEMPLRAMAQELGIPESTIRDNRLPTAIRKLRKCLKQKGIDSSRFFPAQEGRSDQ